MFAMMVCVFASCSDGGNENPVNPSPEPEEIKTEITIDSGIVSNGLSFGASESEQSVSFSVNANWTLSIASTTSGSTWCKASAISGNKGTANVKFAVAENTGYDDRSVSVTIKAGTASKTFTITQKGIDAMLVTTTKYEVAQEGGKIEIEVKANIDYQFAVSETAKDWISETKSKSRTLTTYKHTFDIALNEELEKREGEIVFKSGDKVETVKIYQAGGWFILLSQNEYTVSDSGETISIDVRSNVEYGVQMPDVDWITDEASSRGMSSHTLKYVVAPNESYDSRSAEIIFYDKNSDLRDTLTVTQVQKDAIVISKKNYDVKADGETVEVKLSTNVDFEVIMPKVNWIKQTGSRALKEQVLYFNVTENESMKARTAEIIITDKNSLLTDTLTITQQGQPAPFTLKQTEYVLPLEGSRMAIRIEHKKPYKIESTTNFINSSDITLKTDSVDVLVFSVGKSETNRKGMIVVADEKSTYKDTIYVSQQPTNEELHNGNGNSNNGYGVICHYSGGGIFFDIFTNVEHYDIVIINHGGNNDIVHLSSEKINVGFRETFNVPTNTDEKDHEYSIAFIGPNITFVQGVTVRRQLHIHIDEGKERYLSEEGDTITIHAWTEDDNLNIRLDGDDTSWLSTMKTEDTYVNGVRRINKTFVAEPNKTGKTRELYVVAYNGFNDNERIKLIQPSGEGVVLSSEKMIVGAWKNTSTILLKDCKYTIEADPSVSWITIGQAEKKDGIIEQSLIVQANTSDKERNTTLTIKSGTITHHLKIRQMPESGSLMDNSSEVWKTFELPSVHVKNPYPNETGAMLYFSIVEDPQKFIHIQSRKVLEQLYFTPQDEFIPKVNYLEYVLENFDGVSYCGGGGGMKLIALSNQYVESYYNANGAKALVQENRGVLFHELTHAFQLEPKGCGDYGSSKVFHSCIEGMADAVRTLCGGFPNASDRPKGGHYLDSYRYTGFFIVWLVKNKDKDFLRKFNLSTQYVNPWSFDGAIKYILGEKYNVEELWTEYLKDMGDI